MTTTDTAIVRTEGARASLARIKTEKQLVRHAMESVMKKDMHFGTIPGTSKPTLYDAGATTILSLFHLALDPKVEDLSTGDEIRYRVCQFARHAPSGETLGSAYGEASSNEEKYKWRRAVCREEFEATPEDRRRVKWSRYQNKVQSTEQIRTEPSDIANTVLKMAAKRARIAATLQVTAASDVFAQDLEDLPPEIVEGFVDASPAAPAIPMPKRASAIAEGFAGVIDTPPITVVTSDGPHGTTTATGVSARAAKAPTPADDDGLDGFVAPKSKPVPVPVPDPAKATNEGKATGLVVDAHTAGRGWAIKLDGGFDFYARDEKLFDTAKVAQEMEAQVIVGWVRTPSKRAGETYLECVSITAAGEDDA